MVGAEGDEKSGMYAEWEAHQREWASRVVQHDDAELPVFAVEYLVGVDISFSSICPNEGMVACAIVRLKDLHTVHVQIEPFHTDVPYVPGFLAFREVPAYTICISKAFIVHPEVRNCCVLVIDGNGVWHPRGCGSASQLGVIMDLPSIGVAKKAFHVESVSTDEIKAEMAAARQSGLDHVLVHGKVTGRLLGAAVTFGAHTVNPIFVSVGHRISLETALQLVRKACLHRECLPVRIADSESRKAVRVMEERFSQAKEPARPSTHVNRPQPSL
eukprot:ANDGO_02167.mRNA.1 Endonuclease V